jgi:hypothetical protein
MDAAKMGAQTKMSVSAVQTSMMARRRNRDGDAVRSRLSLFSRDVLIPSPSARTGAVDATAAMEGDS